MARRTMERGWTMVRHVAARVAGHGEFIAGDFDGCERLDISGFRGQKARALRELFWLRRLIIVGWIVEEGFVRWREEYDRQLVMEDGAGDLLLV